MLPRERVQAALAFQPADIIPLQIHPSPGGAFEHGRKLLDLLRRCGHDFDDLSHLCVPQPPAEDFDVDGRYHRFATDEWGVSWEYRLYGVWGYRVGYPLADIARLDTYKLPPIERLAGEALAQARAAGESHRARYYHLAGGLSIFETLQSLRPFEDTLIDIAQDTPEINRLADRLMEYNAALVENALAVGADAISIGDDFGTQQALMMSPKVWRRFFKPRYRELLAPIVAAGKAVFFHSCGHIELILDDLAEVGADAIWPQLPLFDPRELARRCRALGLAVQLHPDRGELLQRGTPDQVRDSIRRLVDEFETASGGSWLYLEVDPGFPWANIEAMVETAIALRQPNA